MAQEKKYKLGRLEFQTEQEYLDATADVKKIKELMAKYDVSNPQQAAKILALIQSHPQAFRSPYGRKFVEKLQAAAGKQAAREPQSNAPKLSEKEKNPKEKKQKEKKAGSAQKEKFQIFTVRNFAVGIIIIAAVVALSVFAPKLFSLNSGGIGNDDIKRNMVTAYAKNQADLKAQLYTYYFNVVGKTEGEAEKDAQSGMEHYVLDLSDRTISTMSDSEIAEIFDQLAEGGDIQNNSFVEPSEITVLKEKLLAAGLANNTGNGVEGETAVVAAINGMMDYQQRLFYSLSRNYSLLGYEQNDYEAFAAEDLSAMFGEVIYTYSMTESDKQNYFDIFCKKGLIKDNQVVRFSTDPTAYNLPDLTPRIKIAIKGKKEKTYACSMLNYAPAASVFYEIHAGGKTGYLCFRNNGGNSKYIQLDAETSVTVQGDFFLRTGTGITKGEWFYNRQDIGLLLNGDRDSTISYVYDLTY